MSVGRRILGACLVFVLIVAVVGGLAQRQDARMGRLAVGIYDHTFMGVLYVDQAQEEFLRLTAAHQTTGATFDSPAGRAGVERVLDRLDVALERAGTGHVQAIGARVRGLVATLPDTPATDLAARLLEVDRELVKLVKRFGADGLEARDAAEQLAADSATTVWVELGVAVCLALCVGLAVGRSLSRPLVRLVGTIDRLAAGELDHRIPAALLRRRDEIGAVARATTVFHMAMRENAAAGAERETLRDAAQAERGRSFQIAADNVEFESRGVTERSAASSELLTRCAQDLAYSAARVMDTVATVAKASAAAVDRSELAAVATQLLSASARDIAGQLGDTASEVASTARAGERAGAIVEHLSAAVSQIDAVTRLIGDVAGRSNLLALNATIEAARAGPAGLGFTVVAHEFKALATQTARATDEIARKTDAIQQAMQEAVRVVGEIVGRVGAIERSIGTTARSVEQQSVATGEIADNVTRAAEAMRLVAGQIGAVSDEVLTTEAAVSGMRALAGAVSERIAEFRDLVVRVIRNSSTAGTAPGAAA